MWSNYFAGKSQPPLRASSFGIRISSFISVSPAGNEYADDGDDAGAAGDAFYE
jgi:hypothetical protein